MSSYTLRTKEEVHVILESAKLDRKDLLPLTQEVVFDPNFSGTEFRLIELDNEIMESIKKGTSCSTIPIMVSPENARKVRPESSRKEWTLRQLAVTGCDPNDAAVLCTDVSTFEMKEAETSNSLLLMEKLAFPEEARNPTQHPGTFIREKSEAHALSVSGEADKENQDLLEDETIDHVQTVAIRSVSHSCLELKRMRPNLGRIRNILKPSSYEGPNSEANQMEMETESEGHLMTFEMLLERVPASAKEIEDYLDSIRVLRLNGYVRLMEGNYLFRVLSLILNCVDEYSWANDKIVKSVIITSLSSMEPEFILEKVFHWFFQPKTTDTELAGPSKACHPSEYAMKEYELCRFFGEVLLKPVGRFNLRDFLKAWQDSVPEGLKTNLKQLEGLAVCDCDSIPAVIWYFSEYGLPETIPERFSFLFETKPKWKLDEIMPYIRNLAATTQNVGILLTKYSRVNTANGIKYYSSKHCR